MNKSSRFCLVTVAMAAFWLIENGKAQTSPPRAAPGKSAKQVRRTKAEEASVYSEPWEAGEIKNCSTYSGEPSLLLCDAF